MSDHYHLYKFLNDRRSGSTHRRFGYQHVHQYTRAPSTSILTEDPIQIKHYDKIFSSAWISDDRVVVGTKDNKLLAIDTMDHTLTDIPFAITMPAIPTSSPTTTKHQQFEREPVTPSSIPSRRFSKCEGIRSLATNPSRTLLAVAVADPPCVMIYRLPELTFLSTTAQEHRDAVFSVQWIDDTAFITGSRDGTMGLWGIGTAKRWKTSGRVRDVKMMNTHEAASLSSSGNVEIWNIHTQQKERHMPLWRTRELVCMAQQQHLLAVGSQEHVTLLDTRTGRDYRSHMHEFLSQDQDWGVRSLELRDHIVTCGGGRGRISFYDVRNHAFVPSSSSGQPYQSVSEGWFDESSHVYRNYFYGQHRLTPQAVYTLAYSPDNDAKLFTGGGPIQSSLKGCHAALWTCYN